MEKGQTCVFLYKNEKKFNQEGERWPRGLNLTTRRYRYWANKFFRWMEMVYSQNWKHAALNMAISY